MENATQLLLEIELVFSLAEPELSGRISSRLRYFSEIKIWTIEVSISVFWAGTATGDKFLFDQTVSISVSFGVTGSRVCMWSVLRLGAEVLVLKDLRR